METRKKEFAEALGAEIKRLRVKKKWSRNKLAKEADVGWNELADVEEGRSVPSTWTVEKIRLALDVESITF